MKKCWCIPAKQNGEFVARMEDILTLYKQPRDPDIPLVCMDEQPVQLTGDKFETLEVKPGQVKKEDYEYKRNETARMFMFTAPLECWRLVDAQEHRTKIDWAHQIRELLTVHFPNAKKIRLVMDNLNIHTLGALYEAFPPDVAFSLANRLEIHYTPKHGSWLNIAEIELSAMTVQCLNRRISNIDKLQSQVSAWVLSRNSSQKSVHWHFNTNDARIKLRSLYPTTITKI